MACPTLKPSSSIAEINDFLASVTIEGWTVHPKLVEFNNRQDRERKAGQLYNQYKAAEDPLDEEAIRFEVDDLRKGDIVENGRKSLKQKGGIVMVSGPSSKGFQEAIKIEGKLTHVALVLLKNRVVRMTT